MVKSWRSGPTARAGGPTGFGVVGGPTARTGGQTGFHWFGLVRCPEWRCLIVRSSSWVAWHMCCMMHILTNVGQVVKNLFPDSICLSIVVQVAWWSTTVNGEDDRD